MLSPHPKNRPGWPRAPGSVLDQDTQAHSSGDDQRSTEDMPFPYLGESVWHQLQQAVAQQPTYPHAYLPTCMHSCTYIVHVCVADSLSISLSSLALSRTLFALVALVRVCVCVPWYDFFYPGPPGTLSQANIYIYIYIYRFWLPGHMLQD